MFLLSETNINPNFEQGKEFLNKRSTNKENLVLIGQTSSPDLGSISETLQNNESVKSKYSIHIRNISHLEKKYNETLVKYTSTYNLLMNEMVNKNLDIVTNSLLWKRLIILNNKLIILAKQLLDNTKNLTVGNDNIMNQINSLRNGIKSHINNLQTDKLKLNNDSGIGNKILLIIFCLVISLLIIYNII